MKKDKKKNITINIGKLIGEIIITNPNTTDDCALKIRQQVSKALLDAVNDVDNM